MSTLMVLVPPTTRAEAAWQVISRRSTMLLTEASQARRAEVLIDATTELGRAFEALGVPLSWKPLGIAGRLTEREFQVLHGMSRGKRNSDIARELFLAETTVKTHARHLFHKLGALDRAHAVAIGFREGLLTGSGPDPAGPPVVVNRDVLR